MKQIIEIPRAGKSPSKVVVGSVITALKAFLPAKKIIIVTDANVHRRYKQLIGEYEYVIIGMGETNKTLVTVEKLYRELIALGADRQTFLLGIGGGIVTDVTGYVASTYMRGIGFGFVATTLLAQVDASIGGKNGVNVDGFKNMVGTFNQPDFVLCDTSMLSTLPEREMRTGLAEIIKAGVIADPALLALLEEHSFEGLQQDAALLGEVITAALRVKAAVVTADEREAGERKKLNLGHTFAHAIEKCSSMYTHGEAVAIGIAMACDVSVRLGLLDPVESSRIKAVIERMGLPLSTSIEPKQLIKAAMQDKKKAGDQLDLILIHGVGDCRIHTTPITELQKLLL